MRNSSHSRDAAAFAIGHIEHRSHSVHDSARGVAEAVSSMLEFVLNKHARSSAV